METKKISNNDIILIIIIAIILLFIIYYIHSNIKTKNKKTSLLLCQRNGDYFDSKKPYFIDGGCIVPIIDKKCPPGSFKSDSKKDCLTIIPPSLIELKWMELGLSETFKNTKPISEWIIPGAHDAGTIGNATTTDKRFRGLISLIGGSSTLNDFVNDQVYDLPELIAKGCRYLDSRVGFVDNNWVIVHGGGYYPDLFFYDWLQRGIEYANANCPGEVLIFLLRTDDEGDRDTNKVIFEAKKDLFNNINKICGDNFITYNNTKFKLSNTDIVNSTNISQSENISKLTYNEIKSMTKPNKVTVIFSLVSDNLYKDQQTNQYITTQPRDSMYKDLVSEHPASDSFSYQAKDLGTFDKYMTEYTKIQYKLPNKLNSFQAFIQQTAPYFSLNVSKMLDDSVVLRREKRDSIKRRVINYIGSNFTDFVNNKRFVNIIYFNGYGDVNIIQDIILFNNSLVPGRNKVKQEKYEII